MKKLLMLTALLLAVCAQAQVMKVSKRNGAPKSLNRMTAKQTITPTDNQIWWGYYTENDGASIDYSYDGLGFSEASTFDVAIFVPSSNDFVRGSTIKAIRIWLSDIQEISDDLTIWISKTIPTDISAADYSQTVSRSSLVHGVNDIELTKPFSVNSEDVYVGYSISISSRAYPIICNGTDMPNAFFFRHNSGKWQDFTGSNYGKLALRILLENESFPTDRALTEDFGRVVALQGSSPYALVVVKNEGANVINEVSYTITTDDGTPSEEHTVSMGSLSPEENSSFRVVFDDASDARKYVKAITITKVNGVANTAKQKTSNGCLIVTREKPAVLPVVEEFTGTWCGYCPYGIVGMQKTHEEYGDEVALIAVHDGDVMDIGVYGEVIGAYVNSYPSSRIGRGPYPIYPSSSLVYYLRNYFDTVTQGSIELTAQWANTNQTAVKFSTTSKFYYDGVDEQYGIAFVLVEDGLTGDGSSWAQSNFLSGMSGDAEMSFWYNAGEKVTGLKYDHVAVAAWDVMNGINGSIGTTIQTGAEQKFSFLGDITPFRVIQDKSKLKAIALLIDRGSGRIVNAAQATIGEADEEIAGDADGNSDFNIDDVMMTVSYLLGENPKGFSETAADMDESGTVDIVDITLMIKALRDK